MAYVKSIERICQQAGCAKIALFEVFNRVNGSVGVYCSKHATAKVKTLNEQERLESERRLRP
jgi:hypothetical protein